MKVDMSIYKKWYTRASFFRIDIKNNIVVLYIFNI
jgi:hypothetical protein